MHVHLIASDDPGGVARQFPFYWTACGQSVSTTRLSAGEGVSCPACLAVALASVRSGAASAAGDGEWEFEEISRDELDMDPAPLPRAPLLAPPDEVLLRELLLDPADHPSSVFGVPDARAALTPEERREIGGLLSIIVQFGLSDRALPIARAVFRLCARVSGSAGSAGSAPPEDETPVRPSEEAAPSEDVTESGDEE